MSLRRSASSFSTLRESNVSPSMPTTRAQWNSLPASMPAQALSMRTSVSLAFASSPLEHPADGSLRSEFSPISIRRPVSTSGCVRTLPGSVLGRIVRDSVLPHPPDHPQPRRAQHPDGVRMVAAALTCPEIDVLGPRIVQAAGVGQGGHGVTQVFVARSAEGSHLTPPRLLSHRRHPGVCGQRLGARIALTPVADLREELGGGQRRTRVAK